jgi:hypothetical protein
MQLKNSFPEWIDKVISLNLKMVLEAYFDLVQDLVKKMDAFLKQRQSVLLE